MPGRRPLLVLPLFAVLVVAALGTMPRTSPTVLPDRPASIVAGAHPSIVDAVLPSSHLGDRPTTHRATGAAPPVTTRMSTRSTTLLPELPLPALPGAPAPLVAPRAPPALG